MKTCTTAHANHPGVTVRESRASSNSGGCELRSGQPQYAPPRATCLSKWRRRPGNLTATHQCLLVRGFQRVPGMYVCRKVRGEYHRRRQVDVAAGYESWPSGCLFCTPMCSYVRRSLWCPGSTSIRSLCPCCTFYLFRHGQSEGRHKQRVGMGCWKDRGQTGGRLAVLRVGRCYKRI